MQGLSEGSVINKTESEIFNLITAATNSSAKLEKHEGSKVDLNVLKTSIYYLKLVEFTLNSQTLTITLDDINSEVKSGSYQGKNVLWQALKLAHNNYRKDYLKPLSTICNKYSVKDLNWLASAVGGEDRGKSALTLLASAILKAVIAEKAEAVAILKPILQQILKEIPLRKLDLVQEKQVEITANAKEFLLVLADLFNKGHPELLEKILKLLPEQFLQRSTSVIVDTTPTVIPRINSNDSQLARVKSKHEVTKGHTRHGTPPDHRGNPNSRQQIKSTRPESPLETSPRALAARNNEIDTLLNALPHLDEGGLIKNRESYLALIQDIVNLDSYSVMSYVPGKKIPPIFFKLQSWFFLSLLHVRFDNEKFKVVLENIVAIRDSLFKRRQYNVVYMIYDVLNSDSINKVVEKRNIKLNLHRKEVSLANNLKKFSEKLQSNQLTLNPTDYPNMLSVFFEKREECWKEPFTFPLAPLSQRFDFLRESFSQQKQALEDFLKRSLQVTEDSAEESDVSEEDLRKYITTTEKKITSLEELLKIVKVSILTKAAFGKDSNFSEKIKLIPFIGLKDLDAEYEAKMHNWFKSKNYIDLLPAKESPETSPQVMPHLKSDNANAAKEEAVKSEFSESIGEVQSPSSAPQIAVTSTLSVRNRINFFKQKFGESTQTVNKNSNDKGLH